MDGSLAGEGGGALPRTSTSQGGGGGGSVSEWDDGRLSGWDNDGDQPFPSDNNHWHYTHLREKDRRTSGQWVYGLRNNHTSVLEVCVITIDKQLVINLLSHPFSLTLPVPSLLSHS